MVIDAHTHMPSPGWKGHDNFFPSVAAAVKYLKNAGVDAALFNTWQGVFAETEDDLDTANKQALKLAKKFKGFLYPGAVVHPSFPDKSKEWLERFRDKGFMWVGELVSYRCNIEFKELSWMSLFEYCAKHGHAVQLHNCESVVEVAEKFPDMQVIGSHINVPLLDKLAANDNTWLDISGSHGGLVIGGIEAALKIFGADRLLFGSDFTGYEPGAFIARLGTAVKNKYVKEKIFSKNVIRLLNKIKSNPIF